MQVLEGKRILLIISGGIAAYKCLELIRRLKERGANVRCVLTAGGGQFVTPLSLAALSGEKVYSDLFSLTDEAEMGHIRLSREADLVVVAPASADLLARMAAGRADDLAAAVLLATDKPVLVAPAMNTMMWRHPATRRNVEALAEDGVHRVGPAAGDLACGEVGEGRMAEPDDILAAIERVLAPAEGPLCEVRALVTSGPTREPIDPVRYIANRSSGKQGHAIARALGALGAEVTLVTGPTALADPAAAKVVHVETAEQMLAACREALPVDVAVCAAAVADWRAARPENRKIKRQAEARSLELVANPDILASLSRLERGRPTLVIGFAAETERVVEHATDKRAAKGCDWIVANDVSDAAVFGGEHNAVHVIDERGAETWARATKAEIAERLARRIVETIAARGRIA
jgi:phosphopantothenoylcysteine decarboxylase/phosphopantothenate--cysteine ligase